MRASFSPSPVFNKGIPLVRCTFVAVSNLSSTKSLLFILSTRSGTGGIVGSVELLKKVWEILKVGGAPLGLVLNPQKCEWSWLRANRDAPSPIVGVPVTPTDEIQMLGVPLGSQEFVEKFVERELL